MEGGEGREEREEREEWREWRGEGRVKGGEEGTNTICGARATVTRCGSFQEG